MGEQPEPPPLTRALAAYERLMDEIPTEMRQLAGVPVADDDRVEYLSGIVSDALAEWRPVRE